MIQPYCIVDNGEPMELLRQSVALAATAPDASLELLYRAASLGLAPAVGLLGAELWVRALEGRFAADQIEDRALEGIGWMTVAADLGDENAAAYLVKVFSSLTPHMRERWAAASGKPTVAAQ